MNDQKVLVAVNGSRRRWLAHCSLSLVGFAATGAGPVFAQGPNAAPVILVVGDSLSAEYGLARGSGWVALLERRLAEQKLRAQVINASISGDTTAGGRARLPALLRQHRPNVVVIELGGNDALRGLPLASTRANLTEMAHAAREQGAKVLLIGMQVPPNYGRQYSDDFAAIFAAVATAEQTALVPFLLRGVADGADAMQSFQPDRIHPLATAHPQMLDNVWPVLKPLLGAGR